MPLLASTPLLVAGLGATAVGTGLSMYGNAQSQDAINAARNNEAMQQQKLQKQANTVFQASAQNNSVDTTNAALAKGTQTRAALADALRTAAQPGATPLPATDSSTYAVTDSSGKPVNNAATRTGTAGNAWSNVVGRAADKLGSYGDFSTQQNINNSQANNNLGVINNKAAADANLLPLEIQVASHKGDALTGWGSIVSSLGSVASMAGASGLGVGTGAGAWASNAGKVFDPDLGIWTTVP